MNKSRRTVIGIDVGGSGKGFHAVALNEGKFKSQHFIKASEVKDWCHSHSAQAIAIDAPCAWSSSGVSRFAERSLSVGGQTIQCFKTPTRAIAKDNCSDFYGWVFNGEKLYQCLAPDYQLFGNTDQRSKIVLETFTHAVVCS